MNTGKKVSFGSKNSMVETRIIDDAAVPRKTYRDVREITGDQCDDTMTSANDIVAAGDKAADTKTTRHKHVTIGDSTFVVMTPDDVTYDPSSNGVHTPAYAHYAVSTSSSSSNSTATTATTTTTISTSTNSGTNTSTSTTCTAVMPANMPGPKRPLPSDTHGIVRSVEEEFYDVLNPQPKDQT